MTGSVIPNQDGKVSATLGQATREFLDYQQELLQLPEVLTGTIVDSMRNGPLPAMIRGWSGLPGHGKTTVLRALARAYGRRIVEAGLRDKYYAMYISFEELRVYHMAYFMMAHLLPKLNIYKLDIRDMLYRRYVKRGEQQYSPIPPEMFAQAGMAADMEAAIEIYGRIKGQTISMTVKDIIAEARFVAQENGRFPLVILMDYIQDLEIAGRNDGGYQQLNTAMMDVMDLAAEFNVPLELGMQTNKRVLFRDDPMPEMGDAAEGSHKVAQKCASINGILRPYVLSKFRNDGYDFAGQLYSDLRPDAVALKSIKGRHAQGIPELMVSLNPTNAEIREYETQRRRTQNVF